MVTGVVTNYLDGLTTNMEKGHALSSSQLDENDELWLRILQEVSNKNNTAVRSSLIVLGNERSGKSSLLARLMGGSRKPMNSVLEYNYLQIHADASASYVYQLGGGANGLLGPTDSATLPVWILDGRDEMTPMLKFAFPSSLAKCVVILCASLEQPGNVLPTLRRWYRLLDEQIRQHYSADDIFQAQQMQVRFWQEYVEPIESSLHSTATLVDINGPSNIGSMVGDQGPSSPLLLPPEKGILEENCGATLFVVITKSDLHTEFTNEQLDKVQYHVRQFCLRHGAALFYTSSKEDLNTQMLLKYIAHRIYALPFTTPAYIVEKDSIFVPMGWDSEQKLSIVKESLGYGSGQVPLLAQQTDTSSFTNKISGEKEIEADDEQVFLNKLSSITHDSANSGQLRSSGQQSPRQGGKGPVGGQAGGGDNNNTMLANFFSSLLTKDIQRPSSTHSNKSGHSPTHPTTASSIDAELHFKKMLANKRSGSEMTEDVSKTIIDEKQKDLEDNEDEEEKEDRDSEEEMEENNEDFEDAPDVDATSINSSSKNVTPRTDSDDVKVLASIEEQTTLIVSETLEQEK